GCALVVGTGVIAMLLAHKTMWFAIPTVALPAALATWTLWMVLVRVTGISWDKLGAVAVVALTFGYFDLLRNDGAWSDLKVELRWRWQLTEEQKFVATHRRPDASSAGADSLSSLGRC